MTATLAAVLGSLGFLVGLGLLPALAITRSWALAVPLSGLVTGLLASAAATASLLSGSSLRPWLLAVTLAAWALAALALRRRPRLGPPPAAGGATVLVVAALSALVLAGATAAPTEWDARMIWFFRARWFWLGGEAAADAMGNPALFSSHADYPPLVPATIASLWSVAGGGSLALAQVLATVQTWMAVVFAAVLAASTARRHVRLPVALAAGAFALACFGVAGGFGARGYADLLWAAAAVAGSIALLELPLTPRNQLIGACCLLAAMVTKAEGFVAGFLVLLPLAALRWVLVERRAALPRLLPLAAVFVVAAVWPVIAARYVAVPQRDVDLGSVGELLAGQDDKRARVVPALEGLWGYTRLTFLTSAAVVLVGWAAARSAARAGRAPLPVRLWLPAAAAGCFLVSFVALAAGQLDVRWWVEAGGFRTMTVVRALLLAQVLLLAIAALDRLEGWQEARQPGSAEDDEAAAPGGARRSPSPLSG